MTINLFVLHLNCLDLRNVLVQCCSHDVTPMPDPMASHDQKSHVAPDFKYLYLRNAILPLTVMLASYDADTNTNGNCMTKKDMFHIILNVLT